MGIQNKPLTIRFEIGSLVVVVYIASISKFKSLQCKTYIRYSGIIVR